MNLVANAKTGESAASQWANFNDWISNDKYLNSRRGQFTERNGARTPWNNQLDLRIMQEFTLNASSKKTNKIQISFDVINLSNMINKNWGTVYYAPNTLNSSVDMGLSVVTRGGSSTAAPTYNFTRPASTYSIDQFASRWQGQVGVRYIF